MLNLQKYYKMKDVYIDLNDEDLKLFIQYNIEANKEYLKNKNNDFLKTLLDLYNIIEKKNKKKIIIKYNYRKYNLRNKYNLRFK